MEQNATPEEADSLQRITQLQTEETAMERSYFNEVERPIGIHWLRGPEGYVLAVHCRTEKDSVFRKHAIILRDVIDFIYLQVATESYS